MSIDSVWTWNSKQQCRLDPKFWDHPENWPDDSPGFVFLARALDELGRAEHRDQWEQSIQAPDAPPEVDDPATKLRLWEEYECAEEKYEAQLSALQAKKQEIRADLA